ncbi:MAG: hypothetical protein ACI865_002412 [Flavobacteriaceae bacterium]|jgi:hypothetical protein
MAFNGREGGTITLKEGAALTAAYRNSPLDGGIKGHFIGKDIIQNLLAQEGCMGIRVYYGQDSEEPVQKLVYVGVDAEENDMLDLVADMSVPCPKRCGQANVLNS